MRGRPRVLWAPINGHNAGKRRITLEGGLRVLRHCAVTLRTEFANPLHILNYTESTEDITYELCVSTPQSNDDTEETPRNSTLSIRALSQIYRDALIHYTRSPSTPPGPTPSCRGTPRTSPPKIRPLSKIHSTHSLRT